MTGIWSNNRNVTDTDFFSADLTKQKRLVRLRNGCVVFGCATPIVSIALFFAIGTWSFGLAGILALVGLVFYASRVASINSEAENAQISFEKSEAQRLDNLVSAQSQIIRSAIAQHVRTLRTKRSQLSPRDEYGRTDRTRWKAHVDYFLDTVVAEEMGTDIHHSIRWDAETWIEEACGELNTETETPNIETLGGIDYENFCAGLLREAGWTVVVTKASQDQGVDLIATHSSIKVVVQCKRYAGAVGNQAVQEVLSAKVFEDADYAVVVSNAPFTKSARALANKGEVLLLNHSDLSMLAEALRVK